MDAADTNWILVGQKIAPLSQGTHRFFEGERMSLRKKSEYKSVSFSYDLIVDATEFRFGDAEWLLGSEKTQSLIGKNLNLVDEKRLYNRSSLPMETSKIYLLANARSVRDGLDSVYRILSGEEWQKSGLPSVESFGQGKVVVAFDSSANGYRVPFYEEWAALQRAGGSASAFCRPSGQKAPNPYGLYDVYGNALEYVLKRSSSVRYYHMLECQMGFEYDLSAACWLFFDMVGRRESERKKICMGEFDSDGKLVETCSPYKLRMFLDGFRLVRKLR